MNSVQLIGRIANDPNIKYVGHTHRPLCAFTLAVEQRVPPDPATHKRPCFFFQIKVWGLKAEHVISRIERGQRIAISGELIQEQFTPQGSSEPIQRIVIQADHITPLDKSSKSAAA
jgi:single-strand DNA-binding protein